MEKQSCIYCSAGLEKDAVALNKKLLGRSVLDFMCLSCLAKHLSSSEDDLKVRIKEFKERGCKLFA